ncbi:5'-nucleotidase C-terminal domain-containing protein [Paracoccus sp. (in: a-proteobacteria)]|uniref:5'-nucleotidase C-terminal domain-containing protein n=1 Tax=Paracoccus sp. TaxID=267 RepID=UPI0026E0A333|nr:5'-nucleotidase C-terminal domain-containing protein [Paracoccus sp. (in: a-proteobacteria)]MDO5646689.1 5'-nucleotidase C-terminal domain-containing protein [Paracoccus sp. (in: a-proteobacteria)]
MALLRILATTDIHMRLLPYDYFRGEPARTGSLARAATVISGLRQGAPGSVLLDNGDFLQGTPLADAILRRVKLDPKDPNPVIQAMNVMGYDAASLGNHDFNYGLSYLRHAAGQARFPMLAANLRVTKGPGFGGVAWLKRRLPVADGRVPEVKIAVIGLTPPQTADWDRDLARFIHCDDMIDTAREIVPQLRDQGADVVIALAHSGIGASEHRPRMENAAAVLAHMAQIDAVIAGHSHAVLPPAGDVTVASGAAPLVMPGYGGSHVGVIDLRLAASPDGRLRVDAASARCVAVTQAARPAATVTQITKAAHRQTVRDLARVVGHCATPLNSFFSTLGHDAGLRLVNMAQRWHLRHSLRGTAGAGLPVLSAAAPFRAGGRGGPDHYTHVQPGAITNRDLADLYSFPNRFAALILTGAQLREWLERAAGMFHQITPGAVDSPLCDTDFPAYNFDVIEGVTWSIDLSQPAQFTVSGDRIGGPGRVRGLRWNGAEIDPDQRFAVATNSFRLARYGLYADLVDRAQIIVEDGESMPDLLARYFRRRRRIAVPEMAHWLFRPMPGTSVVVRSSPDSAAHRDGLPVPLDDLGRQPDGFQHYRLTL